MRGSSLCVSSFLGVTARWGGASVGASDALGRLIESLFDDADVAAADDP